MYAYRPRYILCVHICTSSSGVGSPQFHSQYQYQQQQQQQQVKLNEMTSTVLGAMSESALPASAIAAAKKNKAKSTAAAEAEAAAIAAETLAFSEDVPTGTMGLDAQRQWDAQVSDLRGFVEVQISSTYFFISYSCLSTLSAPISLVLV